jgi:hypothetical protein
LKFIFAEGAINAIFRRVLKKIYTFVRSRRNGRAVECGGLENRCPGQPGPGVRIPLPPLNSLADKSKTPQIIDYVGFFIFPPKQN